MQWTNYLYFILVVNAVSVFGYLFLFADWMHLSSTQEEWNNSRLTDPSHLYGPRFYTGVTLVLSSQFFYELSHGNVLYEYFCVKFTDHLLSPLEHSQEEDQSMEALRINKQDTF